MAPNDLTPCRMAFYFVSTFAIAQTPTKQPALRLSRTKNLHFAKAPFPGFSAWIVIHQIKALHNKGNGLSERKIAKQLGISRNTVSKYLNMPETEKSEVLSDTDRAKKLDEYRSYIIQLLQTYPELSAVKVLRKLKAKAGSRYFCESLFWASQPKQAAKT